MLICGIQKLSLLDYPQKLAATIFTGGCNLRCPFCHNAPLVTSAGSLPPIPQEEILKFLQNRIGKLDGVCITGGEPLLQTDIEQFIIKVRALGFLIKLDTNGCFPQMLSHLINEHLIDYIAMDIKNSPEKYAATVGVPGFDTAPIMESVEIIKNSDVPYEFRTTLVRQFHSLEDLIAIGKWLKGAENYFLQNFEDSGDLVGGPQISGEGSFCGFSHEEIDDFQKALTPYFDQIGIRG